MENQEVQEKINLNKVVLEAIQERCIKLQQQGYQGNTDDLAKELTDLIVSKLDERPEASSVTSSLILGYMTLGQIMLSINHLIKSINNPNILDNSLVPRSVISHGLDVIEKTIKDNLSWAYSLSDNPTEIEEKINNLKETIMKQTGGHSMILSISERDGKLIVKVNDKEYC